jgi:hypothetical protein
VLVYDSRTINPREGARMWDWDAEPAAKKKPAPPPVPAWSGAAGGKKPAPPPVRAWLGAATGLIVALVVAWLVLPTIRSAEATGHLGAVPAEQTDGPSEEQLEQAAGLLLGHGMTPENPDAQNLGPAETLVLVDPDDELHLTPGAPTVRNEPCFGGPLLAIPLTATATKGSPVWDTSAFKLLDADNHEAQPLTQCTTGGELAFPAITPRWLLYAPDGGTPQARWRLS